MKNTKRSIKPLLQRLDYALFGWLVRLLYPQYYRPRTGYYLNFLLLLRFGVPQKLFRVNGSSPWPVHFTSKVLHPGKVTKGMMVDPGDSPGCYINAANGIHFGSNIEIGPGVKLLSANHDPDDYARALPAEAIKIGDHVWIGANAVILPGVQIGTNVIIGAGSVVTKDIPDNTIAAGNPCRPIKAKAPYPVDIWSIRLNRRFRPLP